MPEHLDFPNLPMVIGKEDLPVTINFLYLLARYAGELGSYPEKAGYLRVSELLNFSQKLQFAALNLFLYKIKPKWLSSLGFKNKFFQEIESVCKNMIQVCKALVSINDEPSFSRDEEEKRELSSQIVQTDNSKKPFLVGHIDIMIRMLANKNLHPWIRAIILSLQLTHYDITTFIFAAEHRRKRDVESTKLKRQRDKLQPRIEKLEHELIPAHKEFNRLNAQYERKKNVDSKKQAQQAYNRCQMLNSEYLPIKSKDDLLSFQLESDTLEFELGDTLFHMIACAPLSPHVMQLLILHNRSQLYAINDKGIPPLFYAFQSPGTLINAICIMANSTLEELKSCIKPNGDTLLHEILILYKRLLSENDGIGQQACVGIIQQLVTLGLDITQMNDVDDSPLKQMVAMDTSLMRNTLSWIYVHHENLRSGIAGYAQSTNKDQLSLALSKCIGQDRLQSPSLSQYHSVEGQKMIEITIDTGDGKKHSFPVEVPDYYPVKYAIEEFKASDLFIKFASEYLGEPKQVFMHMCPVNEEKLDSSAPNNQHDWIEALFRTAYGCNSEIRKCLYQIVNANTLIDSALAKDPKRDDIAKEIVLLGKHHWYYEAFKQEIEKAVKAYQGWCSTWNQVNIGNQEIRLKYVLSGIQERDVNEKAAKNFLQENKRLSFEEGINRVKARYGNDDHDAFSIFLFNQFVNFCGTDGQFINVFFEMAGERERPIFNLQREVKTLFGMGGEDSKNIDSQLARLRDVGNVDPCGLLPVALEQGYTDVVKALVLHSSQQHDLFNQAIEEAVHAYRDWCSTWGQVNIGSQEIHLDCVFSDTRDREVNGEATQNFLEGIDFREGMNQVKARYGDDYDDAFSMFLFNQFVRFCQTDGQFINVFFDMAGEQERPIFNLQREVKTLFEMRQEDINGIDQQLGRLRDVGNVEPYGLLGVALQQGKTGIVKALVLRSEEQRRSFNQVIKDAVQAYQQWLAADKIDDDGINDWVSSIDNFEFRDAIAAVNQKINEGEASVFSVFLHNCFFDFCGLEKGDPLKLFMNLQEQLRPVPEHEYEEKIEKQLVVSQDNVDEMKVEEVNVNVVVALNDVFVLSVISKPKNDNNEQFKQALNKAIKKHRNWHEEGEGRCIRIPRWVSFLHHHGQDSLDRGKDIQDKLENVSDSRLHGRPDGQGAVGEEKK